MAQSEPVYRVDAYTGPYIEGYCYYPLERMNIRDIYIEYGEYLYSHKGVTG